MLTFFQVLQVIEDMRKAGASDETIVANLCELRDRKFIEDEIPHTIAANIDIESYEAGLNLYADKNYKTYCRNIGQTTEVMC